MRQASHYRAPDPALAAAVVTPIIGFRRPAGEDRTFGFNALASDFQPEATKTAETSQIRAREGSVGHVEVFQMGSVRTPIFGGPRPLQPAATPQPRTALPTPSFMKSRFRFDFLRRLHANFRPVKEELCYWRICSRYPVRWDAVSPDIVMITHMLTAELNAHDACRHTERPFRMRKRITYEGTS